MFTTDRQRRMADTASRVVPCWSSICLLRSLSRQLLVTSYVCGTWVFWNGWDLCRDVAMGAEGVRPLWGLRAPVGRRPARAKTPAEATETLTEVTKSVRKRQKSTSGQSGPLWLSGPTQKKKQGPRDYQGPQWQPKSSSEILLNIRGPSLSGALWISGVLWASGTLCSLEALSLLGVLPTVRGPLNIRGSNGRFKLGALKFPTFYFSLHFVIGEFGSLPKNSGANPETF